MPPEGDQTPHQERDADPLNNVKRGSLNGTVDEFMPHPWPKERKGPQRQVNRSEYVPEHSVDLGHNERPYRAHST